MLKRTFLKVAALTALSLAAPQIAAAADALAEIEKSGTIRVAVPQDFPPFGSVGPDMTPQGYDIDVAKLIADKIGVELELVPVWIDNLARVMPKGKLLPLPLLCTATFGEPLRLQPGEDKSAFLERARNALLALQQPIGAST